MALARVGNATLITSLADTSAAAVQCNAWYDICRVALLRDFTWPWAQGFSVLNQVSTNGQRVNAQWVYSYRYPTDALFLRKISITIPPVPVTPPPTPVTTFTNWYPNTWLREDGDALPIPFSIGSDTQGRLIFTDSPNATAWYTRDVSDPVQFAPDFSSLLAWRIASEIAYALAVSDTRRDYAQKQYESEMRKTRANALNEMQGDVPLIITQSEVARARFGG